MSYIDVLRRISLWLLLAAWGLTAVAATAAAPDKDKDKAPRNRSAQAASKNAADCTIGRASADLDINNVRARVFNTGSLFYSHTDDSRYEVPKGADKAPIFASGIWIGGMAGDELRMAAATYAQGGEEYEFFPGPIDAAGNPPANCTTYDRMYKISRQDIETYNATKQATQDMIDWPFQLGAPVTDGDGNPGNYNLANGDRPTLTGDQMVWWVMNDAAGEHLSTLTNPIGLEIQATAFSFNTADALNNTTFYKYKLVYKPKQNIQLHDTWLGLWADPDLGDANDDYVSSDTLLGLGIVYNGDPFDGGSLGYGSSPPALGYDFFQGPLVNNDGIDNNNDGTVDEDDERLAMTRFVYYNNVNGSPTGNPDGAEDYYGYLQGLWTDNTPMTFGGDGYGGTQVTRFMFPNEPPAYWSEDNVDGKGGKNTPSDRRFLMSTGPFTMNPGDEQEIVFGIVWSQTRDRIGSIKQLKADDILAQGAFDFNFQLPPPPAAPVVQATEMDGQVILSWSNPVNSNNFLNAYDAPSPFLADQNAVDQTYSFEGYKIYQYPSLAEEGVLVATMDIVNGVTTVVDNAIDPTTGAPIRRVTAQGADTGVQDYFVLDKDYIRDQPLRNFTEYYFGIQAYAYNAASDPQVRESPIVKVRVVPQSLDARNNGTVINAEFRDNIIAARTAGIGEGAITAVVADPARVTGDQYDVKFYRTGGASGDSLLTYDIVNKRTGNVLVNGRDYYAGNKKALPFGQNLFVLEGLSFSVSGPPPSVKKFEVVSNAGGPLNPPEIGTYAFNNNGFPLLERADGTTVDRPTARQQVSGGNWGINQGSDPASPTYEDFVHYATRDGLRWATIIPNNFEIRFTERGGKALIPKDYTGADRHYLIDVTFELWNTGTSPGAEDDVRYFPYIFDVDFDDPVGGKKFGLLTQAGVNATNGLNPDGTPAVSADHSVSGGTDDPYTDLIYWVIPANQAPGEAGYNALVDLIQNNIDTYSFLQGAAGRAWERMVLVSWNRGQVGAGAYAGKLPETGTTFRITTAKPIVGGDVYTVNTEGMGVQTQNADQALVALDKIAIVPNPYRGASAYDVSSFQDEARITNLPIGSRVRIYSLSGTLIFEDTQRSNDGFYRWDLTTRDGLPIASGMYLIHVDVPEVGERVLKFGVVKKRVQLDIF